MHGKRDAMKHGMVHELGNIVLTDVVTLLCCTDFVDGSRLTFDLLALFGAKQLAHAAWSPSEVRPASTSHAQQPQSELAAMPLRPVR